MTLYLAVVMDTVNGVRMIFRSNQSFYDKTFSYRRTRRIFRIIFHISKSSIDCCSINSMRYYIVVDTISYNEIPSCRNSNDNSSYCLICPYDKSKRKINLFFQNISISTMFSLEKFSNSSNGS